MNLQLEPGERLYSQGVTAASLNAMPYGIAVTDRAIFTLAKRRGFVSNDPWYYERVPLSHVRSVRLARASPVGAYVLAATLVILALAVGAFEFFPMIKGGSGYIGKDPIVAVITGIIIAVAARGKKTIVLETATGTKKLTPPSSIAVSNKALIERIQLEFVEGCRKAGVQVLVSPATLGQLTSATRRRGQD
jgi:hypothetical protein